MSRRGFTLIESLVAIVVLAIAVPPLTWAIREAHIQRVDPVLASRARWLAVEKLEDIIADRHSTTRGYSYLVTGNYPEVKPVPGYPQFGVRVFFDETQADLSTAGSGYMNVEVRVGWTDSTGDARSLSVYTVLTEYTP